MTQSRTLVRLEVAKRIFRQRSIETASKQTLRRPTLYCGDSRYQATIFKSTSLWLSLFFCWFAAMKLVPSMTQHSNLKYRLKLSQHQSHKQIKKLWSSYHRSESTSKHSNFKPIEHRKAGKLVHKLKSSCTPILGKQSHSHLD